MLSPSSSSSHAPSSAPSFHIETLGCRVNQYEEERLRRDFLARGFREVAFDEGPDVCVINTCTVTHVADKKSRQLIRRALRAHSGTRVIATGCAVGNRHALAQIPERVMQVSNKDKERLVDLVQAALPDHHQGLAIPAPDTQGRARALLKVQDGCDQFCTFCIVPFVRGRSRSRPADEVLDEARRLVGAGYRELVVTGVHVGAYGRDLEPAGDLGSLMERLARESGAEWLRLSSVEPADIPAGLLDTMQATRAICPHLHLALQHASDRILARMRRGYTLAQPDRVKDAFLERFPDGALTADILVGFPGEDDEDFRHLVDYLEATPFAHLHVFPFSPRPGTAASRYPDRVPPRVLEERMQQVLAIGRRHEEAFRKRALGHVVPVLVESCTDGLCRGTTPNYLAVQWAGAPAEVGTVRRVRVDRLCHEGLEGTAS